MKTIAICNQKGGVSKSTTVHALGAGLHRNGFRVLFIDFDPQGNLSYAMGVNQQSEHSSYEILLGTCSAANALHTMPDGDLIAASSRLSGVDLSLPQAKKEFLLKTALAPIEDQYDYAIIDTPPSLGSLTVMALTAADTVIIPAQADIFSLQGIGQLYYTIEAIREHCNPTLSIAGILLTRYNARSILSRDVTEMIRATAQSIESKVFSTMIRECVSIKEAQAKRINIFSYAPKSNIALDYGCFVREYLTMEGDALRERA